MQAAGVEARVFGKVMEFWEQNMPAGMFLRSPWEASHIAGPGQSFTLDSYRAEQGEISPSPIPLNDFISYGKWFQRRAVANIDPRRVISVEPAANLFKVQLEDDESFLTRQVIIAGGISPFARRPEVFKGLPSSLVSHTVDNLDFKQFAGKQVAVIGGSQSALESATLLKEAGAEVEVLVRKPGIHWLDQRAPWLKSPRNPFRRVLYPRTNVGPIGINLIVAAPGLFRHLPEELKVSIASRALRPAGSGWLVPRFQGITITTNSRVSAATPAQDRLKLKLEDGSEREVDHTLLGTGYQVDITRYPFLGSELKAGLRLAGGYPILLPGFESSWPGLFFIGAPAAYTFGPVTRFVSGTPFMAKALTRRILAKTGRPAEKSEDLSSKEAIGSI
jgi:thioredoxin reductase